MYKKVKKRTITRLKKRVARSRGWLLAGAAVILVGVMTVTSQTNSSLTPAAYRPLLAVIAKGESGGNYNAHFGNPANETVRFTDMTVAEVLQWQERYVQNGSFSNAVGKYQFIRPTLVDITNTLAIEPTARFDAALQDRLAIALIERRGVVAYVNDELTREEFAANLAKEWAALPKMDGPNPQESYYAADGVNAAGVSADEVVAALDSLKQAAGKK